MLVFWDSSPGPHWCSVYAQICRRCWVIFEATWWWVAFTCGSVAVLKAMGLNSWEISERTTCYLHSTRLLPHPPQPFISCSVLTSSAHPVCPYTQTVKTPWEVNTHLSQRQAHPSKTLHTCTVHTHTHTHTHTHIHSGTETSIDRVKIHTQMKNKPCKYTNKSNHVGNKQ